MMASQEDPPGSPLGPGLTSFRSRPTTRRSLAASSSSQIMASSHPSPPGTGVPVFGQSAGSRAVHVEAHEDVFRQGGDGLPGQGPGATAVSGGGKLVTEVRPDAWVALNDVVFLLAQIPDAHLEQAGDPGRTVQGVVHHGCVGPLEAFVGGAQVSVGVELEDGHAGEADTAGLHCAQRRRVIPAQDDREPTVLQAALGEGADLAADSVAQEIHPSDRRSVARRRAASLDDRCRELTGPPGSSQ